MIKPVSKSCVFVVVTWILSHFIAAEFIIDNAQAQERPSLEIEGEYSGKLFTGDTSEIKDAGLVVTRDGNKFHAKLYFGRLPMNNSSSASDQDIIELEGEYEDYSLILTGDFPLKIQFIHNRFTALDEENSYMGHLDRVVRVSPN